MAPEKKTRTMRRRIWYGVEGTVTLRVGFIHEAGIGGLSLPHPPVINWLLRRGLTEKARITLSFIHEFAHLQTAPLALLYTGTMLGLILVGGQENLLRIVLVLISAHAAWEFFSEVLTIATGLHLYRRCYEEASMIPRVVFWISMGLLTIVGWIVAIP